MKQSRIGSLVEAILNTFIGFLGAVFVIWPFAAWATGIAYTGTQQVSVVIIFTGWSITRGYVMRRWANRQIHAASTWIAKLIT